MVSEDEPPKPQELLEKVKPELLQVTWDEYRYRHSHFWNAFYRFGFFVIFVSAIPHMERDVAERLWQPLFPVAAFLLTIVATYILHSENARLAKVSERLNALRFIPRLPKDTRAQKIIASPIGAYISWCFFFVLTGLSVLNYFLLSLV